MTSSRSWLPEAALLWLPLVVLVGGLAVVWTGVSMTRREDGEVPGAVRNVVVMVLVVAVSLAVTSRDLDEAVPGLVLVPDADRSTAGTRAHAEESAFQRPRN